MEITLAGLHHYRPDHAMTVWQIWYSEGAGQMVLGATWNNSYPMRHMAPQLQEGARESPTLCRERKYEEKAYHQHQEWSWHSHNHIYGNKQKCDVLRLGLGTFSWCPKCYTGKLNMMEKVDSASKEEIAWPVGCSVNCPWQWQVLPCGALDMTRAKLPSKEKSF